eukprot:6893533-Ditylum_brightwellii.AAC.1
MIWSFTDQWSNLKDCKCQTQPVVPKITAELPIMQWVDILMTSSAGRLVEAALALRPASINRENLPHDEEFTSIGEELVAQALHMHPLYCEDNAS